MYQQQHEYTKIMTTSVKVHLSNTTPQLEVMYAKRKSIIKKAWSNIIKKQETMSIEEISNNEFQASKKRIANLYQQVNKVVLAPRKESIRKALNGEAGARTNQLTEITFD